MNNPFKKRRNYQENRDQKAFVSWLATRHPKIKTIISPIVKYGGTKIQRLIQGRHQKEMGYVKGTLDLLIPVAKCGYHGLFLEFKDDDGVISNEQKEMAAYHNDEGYKAVFVRSFDQAVIVAEAYLL